jgi:hypothetical protein
MRALDIDVAPAAVTAVGHGATAQEVLSAPSVWINTHEAPVRSEVAFYKSVIGATTAPGEEKKTKR